MFRMLAMLLVFCTVGGCAKQQDLPPERVALDGPSPQKITLEPFEDIRVQLHEPSVEIRAWVCLDGGFLEQIACSPGTREHESLVVIRAKPSNIHAALLLGGFESGLPGRWLFDQSKPPEEQLTLIPPQGDKIDVFVRYERDGKTIEEPIRTWVRDYHDMDRTFPDVPWVFGGSSFRENPEYMGPGEHYVADVTGSIIGLVTFGDEVIGLSKVISDQEAIHEPEWEVDIERIPPVGTEVTIIFRRARASTPTSSAEHRTTQSRSRPPHPVDAAVPIGRIGP